MLAAELRNRLPGPSPDALAHSMRLTALIRAEIERAGGWIGFDRYMELTLYAPGLGYYAAGARKFGDAASGGDFVTAPEISPLFAQALAAQLEQVVKHSAAQVLEFGAGSGVLARDLLDALAQRGVRDLHYAIVELSPDLQQRQRETLAGRDVVWLAAPPADFDGAIVANEVLDVMPVQLFVKRDGIVHERGVALNGEGPVFAEAPAGRDLATAVAAIEQEVGVLPAGYGSEVGLVARAWTASLADWLRRGVLLAIDYGFPRLEYYHPQRLMGTLMCHYRQHAHADPLWLPGLNDITAHVDFSAIADAAHAAGCNVLGYTSQAHFLINCGLIDVLKANHTHRLANEAHRLLSEAEMGELFKVLAIGKDVDAPLLGFARGDRTHTL
jgi:SAM-dependent MidA family methyltransferase